MGLGDMLTAAVRQHTGLHYVPSFNDFVSGAADDVEANELDGQHMRDQASHAPASSIANKQMTNKTDDMPAMTTTVCDIHKVNRPVLGPGTGRADWIIDNARGGRQAPSVWQFILQSQGKEKLPSFDELRPPRQSTIGAEELQQHFNVTPSQAGAMVAEADRDNDRRISRQEWEDIMSSA